MDVAGYSARAEAFATELARRYYRQFAGLEGAPSGALYEHAGELFAAGTVDALRAAMGAADDPARRRRLGLLLRFAADGHLGAATAALEAQLNEREGELRVSTAAGEPIRLGAVARAQAHTADAGERARLEAERCAVIERSVTPIALEITEVRHAAARALGWPTYAAMYGELYELDLAELQAQAAQFLAATEPVFAAVVAPAVRTTLNFELDALARSDLPRLFRQPALDARFPAAGLHAAIAWTLGDLGIDINAQPNVVLDLAPRPAKSRRPFCSPVHVPQEVYLVLAAEGGWEDYAALLHEAGHAEHFAAAGPDLPFELRRLGDPAVGEAFAFLLERIADEPAWLRGRGVNPAPYAGVARCRRLLLLRRYAAKLAYECELHGETVPLSAAARRYSRRLSAALHVAWPEATWLTDLDPGLYVAHYLRAWALEARLRETLTERFGSAWFRSSAAGETLRGWWHDSHGRAAEELLTHAGAGEGLDFAALADEFASA